MVKMKKHWIHLGFFTLLCGSTVCYAEWVEWILDGSAAGRFDSNINRSFVNSQQFDDYIGVGHLSAGRAYQIGRDTRAFFTTEFSGNIHQRFDRLDQVSIGGKGVLTHKLGLGRRAPLLRVDMSGGEIFSESRIRTGEQLIVGFSASTWITEFLQGFVGYRFDDRNAARAGNSVFDLQGHMVETGFRVMLADSLQMNLGYSWRHGDVTSNAQGVRIPSVAARADKFVRDDAFGGWTYRAKGQTHSYNVGASYIFLKGHAAASLNYSFMDTRTLNFNYESHQALLSFNYSY
jgi:hypothetical protein